LVLLVAKAAFCANADPDKDTNASITLAMLASEQA
jgi:hypothetical protein